MKKQAVKTVLLLLYKPEPLKNTWNTPHARLNHRIDPERFDMRYLLDTVPARRPHGNARVNTAELRARAVDIAPSLAGRHVILVGRVVLQAFMVDSFMPEFLLTWVPCRVEGHKMFLAHLPHPSSLNHWWNDPDRDDRAKAFLKRAQNGFPPFV